MSVLLAIVLIGWGIAAWFSVLVLVPSCAKSMYRHRLWRLRDCAVDEIRADKFAEPEIFRGLVNELELGIAWAGDVSPFRIGILHVLARDVLKDGTEVEHFNPERAHPKDRDRAEWYDAEFRSAFTHQLFFGSPSGWLLALMFVLVAFPIAFVRVLSHGGEVVEEAKAFTRGELRGSADPETTLALLAGRPSHDKLSLSV